MPDPDLDRSTSAVREFNRFYTSRIGVLDEHLLNSAFSLTEARIIYELAQRALVSASELNRSLHLDAGYLSRLIAKLHRGGFIDKEASKTDGRQIALVLTDKGQKAFAQLDRQSSEQAAKLLTSLTSSEQREVANAFRIIREKLGGGDAVTYSLRPHRPGDLGWIVHRHGALYAQDYGWDETFEALVAEVAAEFIRTFDQKRERCWIAERGDMILGSVLLVKHDDETAKLRLLYVEPQARGLGIGRKLVDECSRFARTAGYRKITLWTNSILLAARRLYEDAGYRLVKSEPHHSFGKDLVGETWELDL
jgi:DNA-binding MarR family transcriptional regulator/ribosomal protein S18 acetylase RimI-like enzyme